MRQVRNKPLSEATVQLHLPLEQPKIAMLDARGREDVVAVVAKLLLEAASVRPGKEDLDDAP